MAGPTEVYLVAGGKYHDIDFARLELLKLLGEHDDVRTHVAESYADLDAIRAADALLTYTCDVRPTDAEAEALSELVRGGKRWFALHGTNAILEKLEGFEFDCPRTHPTYVRTLGSQFLAHPEIRPYTVTVTASGRDHPLVQGIEPFEADDELYLCEYHGDVRPLLETRFKGEAPGFVDRSWPDDEPRPVLYLHRHGAGEVLYLTLGHCRGRWDMRPLIPEYPRIERCSWELPVFHELLRRGLRWLKGGIA